MWVHIMNDADLVVGHWLSLQLLFCNHITVISFSAPDPRNGPRLKHWSVSSLQMMPLSPFIEWIMTGPIFFRSYNIVVPASCFQWEKLFYLGIQCRHSLDKDNGVVWWRPEFENLDIASRGRSCSSLCFGYKYKWLIWTFLWVKMSRWYHPFYVKRVKIVTRNTTVSQQLTRWFVWIKNLNSHIGISKINMRSDNTLFQEYLFWGGNVILESWNSRTP